MWTREALEAKVVELGPGAELERFAAGLAPDERSLLQDVLLARSGMVAGAIRARVRAKGWLRRTWDSTGPGFRR